MAKLDMLAMLKQQAATLPKGKPPVKSKATKHPKNCSCKECKGGKKKC